ncbi:F510_1955 family glycosylhydrolase [Nocardioides antri]|uniref:Exo-alpha-sialidase n=1 Tax=Nocardioides antri TaxID=2607659 RepID=A0A5B1M2D3_9ACTN|nr:hypothetical protein [Nocardioides antri]KAA1426776.1 hypothetical protein F0U47_12495 [Nocardioides antri]
MRRTLPACLLVTALLLSGCAADEQDPSVPSAGDDRAVGHIHGLGVDPADDTLYVATHHGLFHIDDTSGPRRVADRWQDTMAFTVVGPGHFLASGHPDLREDLPPHLGLIESTDAGETWQPLALHGEADFHILEQVGEDLYAYDATSGRLLVTQDHKSFDEVARLPLLSVTADPDDSNTLLATTNQGRLMEIDANTGTAKEVPGPTLALLDTTPEDEVVGIDAAGTIRVRDDAGEVWKRRGAIGGEPAAFITTDGEWYAATQDQVFRSDDDGDTWTRVL